MKKLFTRFLSIAILAIMGGVNSAWAETGDVTTNANIDFSNDIVDGVVTGTKNSMTVGTGSGAAARVEGGWFRQGDVTNVVTIAEGERAGSRDVVNVSFKMAWGNKNGMGSSFKLKDAEGTDICSFSHCRWGSSANTMNINMSGLTGSAYNNAPILDRYTIFDIAIDYASKTITTKVSCQNPNASNTFTATLTNTNPVASFETAGFNVGGNTDRADAFKDLLIKTTEGDYTATTAEYSVKYLNGTDQEIKTTSTGRVGDVNSHPILLGIDKEAIYTVDGKKYVYASDDASTVTIADDNSTVVSVRFSEIPKYNYAIKAQDANGNDLKTLAEGATFTDEAVTMYIPLKVLKDGKLYGISGENSWRSYTITSQDQTEVISYPNVVENVVAYIEGESATGASVCTPTNNQALASCGHMGRGYNLPVGTITENGKYIVKFHYINTNANNHPVTISANDVVIEEISATKSSRADYSTAEFIATSGSNITFSVGGSSTSGVDYIYIVRTGDIPATEQVTITAAGYATYVTPFSMDFSGSKITAYTVSSNIVDGIVTITPVDGQKVPAKTPLVLKGQTDDITVLTEAVSPVVTDLKYSTEATVATEEDEVTYYYLGKEDGVVVFRPLAVDGSLAAGKCFFTVAKSSNVKPLRFVEADEEATAADVVEAETVKVLPTKFFKNNQLVIMKNGKQYNAAGAEK